MRYIIAIILPLYIILASQWIGSHIPLIPACIATGIIMPPSILYFMFWIYLGRPPRIRRSRR